MKGYFFKFGAKYALAVILTALVTALFLFLFLKRTPGLSYSDSYGVISALRQELLHKSILIYGVTALLITFGIAAISLVYSHRVAGPLYRLGVEARDIASGDLSKSVRFRKNDAIHEVADDMNGMRESYKNLLSSLESGIEELKDAVSAMPDSAEGMSGKEAAEKIKKILEKADEINEIIFRVKL